MEVLRALAECGHWELRPQFFFWPSDLFWLLGGPAAPDARGAGAAGRAAGTTLADAASWKTAARKHDTPGRSDQGSWRRGGSGGSGGSGGAGAEEKPTEGARQEREAYPALPTRAGPAARKPEAGREDAFPKAAGPAPPALDARGLSAAFQTAPAPEEAFPALGQSSGLQQPARAGVGWYIGPGFGAGSARGGRCSAQSAIG